MVEEITGRASAQRAHSKLQKPPHMPAPGSGAAAAATNTQWQERDGSRRDARVQFEPPKAARRRASGPAVFVSL